MAVSSRQRIATPTPPHPSTTHYLRLLLRQAVRRPHNTPLNKYAQSQGVIARRRFNFCSARGGAKITRRAPIRPGEVSKAAALASSPVNFSEFLTLNRLHIFRHISPRVQKKNTYNPRAFFYRLSVSDSRTSK